MKLPPIVAVLSQSAALVPLLGDPLRVHVVGDAPQAEVAPYVIWQHISGAPYAHLNCPPNTEQHTIQVDVYADTLRHALAVADAVEDALAGHCYVTRYSAHERDMETKLWRVGFDVNWHTQ